MPAWTPLVIFLLCYALFLVLPRHRSLVACGGGLLLVLLGTLTWQDALLNLVSWNVIALFAGTLVLAELFMESRMPAVLAEWFILRSRTMSGAMLWLCGLASFMSMFLENVAVVLLVAPVAFSLAERLKIHPVRLLVLIALCSNLQGTATLIGDPPSMILGSYMKMSFNDFFVYHGRPGIFFAVQVGAGASMLVAAFLLRKHREPAVSLPVERPRSLLPTWLLIALIAGLSCTSIFDPNFVWLAGTWTVALAAAGLAWQHFRKGEHMPIGKLLRSLDWDTTFFLIGIFIVVGALSESGWIDRVAHGISGAVGQNLFAAFVLIVVVSVVISGFVDNVPFLLAMIPVAVKVSENLGVQEPALLLFALLIGACLGGNITPIGASANVVTIGLLKKHGYPVGFGGFMKIGVPYTLVAVLTACCFIWIIWR